VSQFIAILLIALLILILLPGLLAPIEALLWWKTAKDEQKHQEALRLRAQPKLLFQLPAEVEHYIVYLSGIADMSGEDLNYREAAFLERLDVRLPTTVVVSDVFPYSPSNRELTGQRSLAWLWRRVARNRELKKAGLSDLLVRLRNLLQVLVSADNRYGPIFNLGTAEEIMLGLLRHGYQPATGKPVTIIGISGGGQIAVGALTYLSKMLTAPLRVIALAGVISDDPGINFVQQLYLLQGTRDPAPNLGAIFYPGRWPFISGSDWNKAKAAGKISRVVVGPMKHNGTGGYLDANSYLSNGQSYLDKVVDIMVEIIKEAGVSKTLEAKK